MNKRQRKKAKKNEKEESLRNITEIVALFEIGECYQKRALISTWDEETPFEYFPLRFPNTEPIDQEKLESLRELHKQAI